MNQRPHTSIPTPVFSAFVGLLPIGIAVGVLHGTGAMSSLAVSATVLGGLAVFVPWAVLELDPRWLAKVADKTRED